MLDGDGVPARLPEPLGEGAAAAGKMPLDPLPGPLRTMIPLPES